ncbi:hypothetical protein MNBD_PLANCTO02-3055 [hydrothermal vent metagenome]|uniref:PilZ domain-containing protein n=1 Tax=hydrothermal vent metagenome TaxID=652676 RepID=A0A3B1D724_9ZZZZ
MSASIQNQNNLDTTATRVLDMLDNWSERMDGHQTQKRSSVRKVFRCKMTIFIPEDEGAVGEADDTTIIEVWTRNISKNGICFIYPEIIKFDSIIICLQVAGGQANYFHAQIVRRRQTHENFWEFGVLFKERAHM